MHTKKVSNVTGGYRKMNARMGARSTKVSRPDLTTSKGRMEGGGINTVKNCA